MKSNNTEKLAKAKETKAKSKTKEAEAKAKAEAAEKAKAEYAARMKKQNATLPKGWYKEGEVEANTGH